MNHQLAIEYYNNGLQYAKEKKWDAALELLNKAIAEDPKHVNSYNVLGKVYIQKGEPNTAKRCWRMALRINPDNITAKQCLAAAGKEPSRIQVKTLLWPTVVAILFVVLITTNLALFRRIGNLKAELAKATTFEAQNLGSKTQDSRPKAQDTRGQKNQQAQSIKPASGTLVERPQVIESPVRATQASSLTKASQVAEVYNRALTACKSGQYNQAIEAFQHILEYPLSHELKDNAQYWLAECYYAQKKYAQALTEFQKVKENFPKANKTFDAELKVVYTYYELGRIESAKQKLLQLSKDWPHQQYRSQIDVLSKKIRSEQSE